MVLYLISDLVSASVLPPILLGLIPYFSFLRGFEIIVGGIGGFFTCFLFGLVYYNGDAAAAGGVLILESGIYADDWSTFGAFVAACVLPMFCIVGPPLRFLHRPVGSILWTFAGFLARWGVMSVRARSHGNTYQVFAAKDIDTRKFVEPEGAEPAQRRSLELEGSDSESPKGA